MWYHFRLLWADGGTSCYGKAGLCAWDAVEPWQLTVYDDTHKTPEWFGRGLKAALLAPTAMNQQRFRFTLLPDDTVRAESRGGSYSHVDLGIVKYHFQLGAGRESFRWAE